MKIPTSEFTPTNKLAPDFPGRPLARYPGSKTRLAPWIIQYVPAVHDTYVIPFGGVASTLFQKTRSPMEVVNDLNNDISHLLHMLRDHASELVEKIEQTHWSMYEFELAQQPTDDPIERARRMYCRLWMAYFPFDKSLHFRRQKKFSRGKNGSSAMRPAAKSFAETGHLYWLSNRLRGVEIVNDDGPEVIKRYDYDRAFFYCDPTYLWSTRERKAHYKFEMDETQHRKLAAVLNDIKGMAIISGYASDLYTELYERKGWQLITKSARTNGSDKVEAIWLCPKTVDAYEAEQSELHKLENEKEMPLFNL